MQTQTAPRPQTTDFASRLGLQFHEIWNECRLFRICIIVAGAVLVTAFADVTTGAKTSQQPFEKPEQFIPFEKILEMPERLLDAVSSKERQRN